VVPLSAAGRKRQILLNRLVLSILAQSNWWFKMVDSPQPNKTTL
jgi:hypothetical protein